MHNPVAGAPLKKSGVFFSVMFFFLKDTWCYKENIEGDLAFAQLIWKIDKCGIFTFSFNLVFFLDVFYKLKHKINN